jgi:nucleoside-diphosphate-sugar epimerase
MTARRALVTGAGGFIGANLVRRLLADGHRVTAVVGPASDDRRLRPLEDVELAHCDLRDREAVGAVASSARPEWVFHLAAHGAYSWQTEDARILETNVIGTVHLAQATRDAEAFVHAGSSSEYGLKDHPPAEDEAITPNSTYAVAKAAATLWLAQVPRGATLRLYSVYGPWEEPGRLIPTLVAHALSDRLPPLAEPETARDFVFVDDVSDAFVRAAAAPAGSVYNVASGQQTTLSELVDLAREEFGVSASPCWNSMASRSWDTSTWVGDPERIERELGWHVRTPTHQEKIEL